MRLLRERGGEGAGAARPAMTRRRVSGFRHIWDWDRGDGEMVSTLTGRGG